MILQFVTKSNTVSSPSFTLDPDGTAVELFFEWLGDSSDAELFWESDVSQNGDTIVIDWFEEPPDPQRIISLIAQQLGVTIAPFKEWK
jgi:hypothetical protein